MTSPASPLAAPASLPRGLGAVDRRLTALASCSFLLHFGLAGSLYGDWTDPIVDEGARLATLVEELRALPLPALEANEPLEPVPAGIAAPDLDDHPAPRGRGHEGRAPGPAGGKGPVRTGPDGRIGERPSARLAPALAALDGHLAPALNGPGHATDAVLQRAALPLPMLETLGRPASAGEPGRAGELTLGGTPGVVLRPGSAVGALPGERMAWNEASQSGASDAVKKPGGGAIPGPPPTTFICQYPAPPPGLGAHGGVRACYLRGLDDDPTMAGSMRAILTIGPTGHVLSAKSAGVLGNLSSSVVACVLARLRSVSFAPVGGEGTVLTIPLSFMPR